jgi:hypothetical protein
LERICAGTLARHQIGTEAVARAPSDGYTLLVATPPNAINATLYEKLNFVFLRDMQSALTVDNHDRPFSQLRECPPIRYTPSELVGCLLSVA